MTESSKEPTARISLSNLRDREIRGGAATLVAQAIQLLLYTGTAIALARMITPEDYGLFGIALAIVGFLGIAKDAGMIAPVIQSSTLSSPQLDTLFWFTAGGGLLLSVVIWGAAPLAGWFYADPRLVVLTRVLGLLLFVGGLSTPHRALLRRQMRFSVLATSETIAAAIGCIVAIVAATRGAGYWSLVWLYLISETVQTVFAVMASGWLPGWPKKGTGIRPLARFGGLVVAFDFIGYLNYRFDNLLVGWYLGATALGYYDKAYQFLLLPINQIAGPVSNVAQAGLSATQHDPGLYRASVHRCLLLTTGLGMPLTAFLFANTEAVVRFAFGPQWLPSVPVFQALAPAAFLMSVTACTGWIYLSLGRARRQLPFAVFTTAVTIGAFVVGLNWTIWGVALALSISRVVLFVPTLIFTCAGSPVKWTDLLRTSARPAIAALLSLGISLLVVKWLGNGLGALIMSGVIFGLSYILCWLIPAGGRALLRESFLLPPAPNVSTPVGEVSI